MKEPGEVVDVIDAFDDDDPFDASVSLEFQYLTKSARILRETTIFEPGLTTGGYTSHRMNVGEYVEKTSRLTPRLDIGIYKDLAFYLRLPIVLSSERRIDELDGSAARAGTILGGAPGETLFTLPFEGPVRSGLEHVGLGLDLNILNQARDSSKPTWLLGIETRISPGAAMRPCNANPPSGQLECADPSDINRDGQHDPNNLGDNGQPLEGTNLEEMEAGVSRGTVGLEVHTLMSKRIKYLEPYAGFSALFEFPFGENAFTATDLEGALVNHPPIVGTVTVGMMIFPWENREKFGRLTIDLRFTGDYISEGRDYSELFDALGSSAAPSLRNPKWSRFTNCKGTECDTARSVVDQASEKTYFTGLTLVEAHGSYRTSASVTWQASEYFKLNVGFGYRFEQGHGITNDQPCNPNFKEDIGRSGPCHSGTTTTGLTSTGIPNPAYRPTINAVGRRFYVDQSHTFDVFAKGVVMF